MCTVVPVVTGAARFGSPAVTPASSVVPVAAFAAPFVLFTLIACAGVPGVGSADVRTVHVLQGLVGEVDRPLHRVRHGGGHPRVRVHWRALHRDRGLRPGGGHPRALLHRHAVRAHRLRARPVDAEGGDRGVWRHRPPHRWRAH